VLSASLLGQKKKVGPKSCLIGQPKGKDIGQSHAEKIPEPLSGKDLKYL
jgi:hypothetical protein